MERRWGLAERLDLASSSRRRSAFASRTRTSSRRSLDEPRASLPEQALFVGDRLYEDVRGATELGMTTVQALWFRADEHPRVGSPTTRRSHRFDVLNVVRRLNGDVPFRLDR